jgi:peptidoglycan/LPS O-acetylase OafA/YrhL
MLEFALGAYGALLLERGWTFHSRTMSLVLMTIPVLVYCALFPESSGQRYGAVMNYLFVPGAFLFIMSMAYIDTNNIRSWTSNRFFVRLGNESFSLYMTHALFLWVFTNIRHRVFPSTEQSAFLGEICTCVYIVLCLVLAHFCYTLFEKPAQKWLLARMPRESRSPVAWTPKSGAVARDVVSTHGIGPNRRAARPEA